MNLQPHDRRPVSPMLPAAFGLSAILHLVLLWPLPPAFSGRPAVQQLRARLTQPQTVIEPVAALAGASAPKVRRLHADRDVSAGPGRTGPVIRPPAEPGVAVRAQPAPSESALRALRFALVRGLVASGAGIPEAGPPLTLELRLLARRVVGLVIVRSSGSAEFDARVLAAFKAAAGRAVIPDSLPAEGFAVELELEGGEAKPPNDEPPHASG